MDKYKLEYEIKSQGMSIEEFCKKIGISKSAYYRKVGKKSEFTQGEIQRTIDILKLKSPVTIFFNEKVS